MPKPSKAETRSAVINFGEENSALGKGGGGSTPDNEEETLRQEVAAWETERNAQQIKVNWRFTPQDARIKLKRLYPALEPAGPGG